MFKSKKEVTISGNSVIEQPPMPRARIRSGVPSIVSADMTIKGDMRTTGDLQIEGEVEGDITAVKLVIAPGGTVTGNVQAEDVRICGALNGTVRSPAVTLTSTARVLGDIYHELLTIETGGQLEGQSRRLAAPQPALTTALTAVPPAEPEAPAASETMWQNGDTQHQPAHEQTHEHHEYQHS